MSTNTSANKRLDVIEPKISALEKDVASLKTEVNIQFKEVFTRIKRIEGILIAASGSIILMLIAILTKVG
jgi:hypothetical protein